MKTCIALGCEFERPLVYYVVMIKKLSFDTQTERDHWTSASGNAETADVVCDSMDLVQPNYRVCGGQSELQDLFCVLNVSVPLYSQRKYSSTPQGL